ncbi:hypothetical protein BC829DRAFT_410375 [Chytridium lagenaria]|nr:hypothetical protein BC829DRAFT_410375 [Chytridium lagenaria]
MDGFMYLLLRLLCILLLGKEVIICFPKLVIDLQKMLSDLCSNNEVLLLRQQCLLFLLQHQFQLLLLQKLSTLMNHESVPHFR